jgi:hypothetical protein
MWVARPVCVAGGCPKKNINGCKGNSKYTVKCDTVLLLQEVYFTSHIMALQGKIFALQLGDRLDGNLGVDNVPNMKELKI